VRRTFREKLGGMRRMVRGRILGITFGGVFGRIS